MSDYKINPRTGKFDMVGTASGTPGNGSEYALPVATDEILGGVKVAGNSDIQINQEGFISSKIYENEISMNVDNGDDANDGRQKPVKSIEKALELVGNKGIIYVGNDGSSVINVPSKMSIYFYGSDITLFFRRGIREVNFTADDPAKSDYEGLGHFGFENSRLTLLSDADYSWPVPEVNFNFGSLSMRKSELYVAGNVSSHHNQIFHSTLYITDKFWICPVKSIAVIHLNYLTNNLVKCASFDKTNAAGRQSEMRSKGNLFLVGTEMLIP